MEFNYYYLVDSASVSSKLLVFLYDYVMFYIFIIFLFFIYLVYILLRDFGFKGGSRANSFFYGFIVFFLWFVVLIRFTYIIYYYLYFVCCSSWLSFNWVKVILLRWVSRVNKLVDHTRILEWLNLGRQYVRKLLVYLVSISEASWVQELCSIRVSDYLFFISFFFLKGVSLFLNKIVLIWDIVMLHRESIYVFLYGFKTVYIRNNYLGFVLLNFSEQFKLLELEGLNEKFNYYCFKPIFLLGSLGVVNWHIGLFQRVFNNIVWSSKLYNQSQVNVSLLLELVWTFVPTLILVFIAVPSFWILFCVDELVSPLFTVKCIGNQWYWTYEYGSYGLRLDSYMVWPGDLKVGSLRLLEVDEWLRCPVRVPVRFIVTSSDVIHSWAVPAFGIKVDGIPGRLNQVSFYGTRTGFFFGQCSELCGVNHAFMPIMVEVIPVKNFLHYLELRSLVI